MDPTNITQLLDTLSAQRVEVAGLHDAMLAAILRNLPPDDAARVQAIVQEFADREAELKAAIATSEQQVKEAVLASGASAQGTYLQALIQAPRVTWDTKSMAVYSALHPDVLAYRKVGEPSVQIRARSLRNT
jgi:hypothetical protein